MKFLNVGGNTKDHQIPQIYEGWDHVLLDIDPRVKPDILCDARNLKTIHLKFDSVYCSHVLEHFHSYELPVVLKGILHVLNPKGFAMFRVPNLMALFQMVVQNGYDLDSKLYHSQAGDVHVIDVIYGFQQEIKKTKKDYFAHKNGFSEKTLRSTLKQVGFKDVLIAQTPWELVALAGELYKSKFIKIEDSNHV